MTDSGIPTVHIPPRRGSGEYSGLSRMLTDALGDSTIENARTLKFSDSGFVEE